jgi:uncharacterized protein YutE (UPF0331/DUF86 family)
MRAMTGFRDVAIHQYQELDMAVLRSIVEHRYADFMEFCRSLGL